jgi:hypothetical protein
MELSIANTAGFLSGAILYLSIRDNENKWQMPPGATLAAAALALLSLFSYQSGFGSFLIPFLFHYINVYTGKKERVLIKGIVFYFLMYAVWYVLFKLILAVTHLEADARAGIHIDLPGKLEYFFSHPLKKAFWFNVIVNDENSLARAIYKVLLLAWAALAFVRFGKKNWLGAVKYIAVVLFLFMISYLPPWLVKENYSSNRTMPALNMCVWIVCAEMVLYFIKNRKTQGSSAPGSPSMLLRIAGLAIACAFIILGWYNFRKEFLQPVHEEYVAVKDFIQQHYNAGIKTIYFIKSPEDAFEKKYHIQSSMDEFGVPSTLVDWVPEDFSRQMVFEKTGSRQIADQLTVKFWPDIESFTVSGEKLSGDVLLVNAAALIAEKP